VAQTELEQLAVRAVLALSAPYRQALLLRYVRGLEPSEIARQLELPPSTVRNRIARGLAEVRAELDRRHGRREAWVALLAPGAVLGKGTGTMVVGGGNQMSWVSTKWIAAVAALALAPAVLWVVGPGRTRALQAPESSASAAALAAPAPLVPETMPATMTDRSPATARRSALPPSASPMTATELIVHVTWARDGSPAVDVPLQVESFEVEPYGLMTTGTTDASGTARFAALPSGQQWLDTLRDWAGYVQLVPGETKTIELALPLGLDVDCRVVDREGAGVAGAEVWLSEFGGGGPGLVVGRTDAGGWLALRDLPCEHRSLAARAPGHSPSTQREFRGLPGARLAVRLVLPGPGASLAGVVQDASGTPVAGAEVLIGDQFPPGGERADGQEVGGAPRRHATSDADGSFLVHGLAPGPLELQARAPGYATARAHVELTSDETGHCTLVLPAEASVAGVVRDGGGRPVAGVNIGGPPYSDFIERWTRTAADGSFVLGGLEAGRCLLVADGGTNGHARTELELRAGEEARWDVVLTAGGVVAGVVLDERGAPLARWQVAAVEPGHPGAERLGDPAYSDAAGRFRMEGCPEEPFVLALRAPEEEWGDPVLELEDFRVGDEALVLRALDACRPSAFVEGRLVAADGGPLVEVEMWHEAVRSGENVTHVPDADGRFRIGPLRSGEYTLGAEALLDETSGLYQLRPLRFALQAGETKDLGDVVIERCGWIHARAVAQNGSALPAGTVLEAARLLGGYGGRISFEDLQGGSGPLCPGTYLVRAREGIWRAPDVEVEVRSGETTELELAFEPTTERLIEVVFPDGVPASELELRVLDALGNAFDDVDGDVREGRYSAWVGGLLPGNYSVEARSSDGRNATGELHVLDLAADGTPLVLTLR
jgi:carboxypeptidase family protein/sigma-70-like protein